MSELLLIIAAFLVVAILVMLVVLLVRSPGRDMVLRLEGQATATRENIERVERALRDEIGKSREETNANAKQAREELGSALNAFTGGVRSQMADVANLQKNQLDIFSQQLKSLTQSNEQKSEKLREAVESRLRLLQEDNSAKLEQMRATVDEKLHATLELRLGQSFKLVSERLEQVHRGLGEMQTLATGVGDLKKVLMNVKTRGTWGEIQLGTLLEQLLTPEQYARNVVTKQGTNDRVEFAIKLPGREAGDGATVWLPLDAKFPHEDYLKLLDAQEQANPVLAEEAGRLLETRIKGEARTIKEKYLDPPHTTDFGIMFLPVEGLYAEVLRRPGLAETLQREYRVTVAGPTTLAALLNSLQMGFRTLAIEKRSSEVWVLLGAVKTEFGRFGEFLEKTKKKLDEASTSIDGAAIKSRAIERKLRNVQELPSTEAAHLLASPQQGDEETPSE